MSVFVACLWHRLPPHKRCGPRERVDVVHAQTPSRLSVHYFWTSCRHPVCHLLTSPSSVVFVTPCDISCAHPFHDESRKDLSSIQSNKKGFRTCAKNAKKNVRGKMISVRVSVVSNTRYQT